MKGMKVTVHPAPGFGITSAHARRTRSTSSGRRPDLRSSARSWFFTVDLSHLPELSCAARGASAAGCAVEEAAALFFAMSAEERSFSLRTGMELQGFLAAVDLREEEDEKTVKVRKGLRPAVTFRPYYKITEAHSHRWIGEVRTWLASVEPRGMHGNEPSPALIQRARDLRKPRSWLRSPHVVRSNHSDRRACRPAGPLCHVPSGAPLGTKRSCTRHQ